MKKNPPEIRILTDDVANRIAAGEVVERPAAVAKELLENSIDAGADRIGIEFKHGGKSFIKVVDNGCGMTRNQALTCLEPHATSKISAPEDLFSISTYGFRGEAMPSIASVSKFKIRTRPEAQVLGTEIDIYAGTVNSIKDCGMPTGTEMIVEDLFCSVPARRKFLKTDNVEASHIIKLCKLYALALPDLALSLIENSKVVFRSEKGLNTIERIERVYGESVASKLIPLPLCKTRGISVSGAIANVGESFATSRNICTFINSRPVDCKEVYSAIKEAYSQYIPKGKFAAAFLFIEIPPENVDVNVHPAKREVRLKNEFFVRDFLLDSLSKTLLQSQKNQVEEINVSDSKPVEVQRPAFSPRDAFVQTPSVNSSTYKKNLENSVSENSSDIEVSKKVEPLKYTEFKYDIKPKIVEPVSTEIEEKQLEKPTPKNSASISDWRYIGCLKKSYILFETSKGLVMLSISSALKRIRYEKILNEIHLEKVEVQSLLIPINIKFERADDECFNANRETFASCGFVIEDFGKSFYKIEASPAWLAYSDIENFIKDFVEIARDENKSLKKLKLSDENFAKIAVKRIGRASFKCDESSARNLLLELLNCDNHRASPDGNPTLKEISEAEISRMF